MNKRIFTGNYEECKVGIHVKDIKVDENLNIEENQRPQYIRKMLEEVIQKQKGEDR